MFVLCVSIPQYHLLKSLVFLLSLLCYMSICAVAHKVELVVDAHKVELVLDAHKVGLCSQSSTSFVLSLVQGCVLG